MKYFKLPYFGDINLDSLKEIYRAKTKFKKTNIKIDINFKNNKIDLKIAEPIKKFLENIEIYDEQNKKHIEDDFNNPESDIAKYYARCHLEALDDERLSKLINLDDKSVSLEQQLINTLRLERIGLYPDNKFNSDSFAVFDYMPKGNIYGKRRITDEILVVNTNENGKLNYLTQES